MIFGARRCCEVHDGVQALAPNTRAIADQKADSSDTESLPRLLENFVDGRFVAGEREFDDINPADGTLIARVAEAGPELVDEAVKAARKALQGEWGRWGVRQRAALLYKIAEGIEARFDEFVAAESADTGKPVALASRLDVPRAAANFRVFADLIKTAPLEAFETETPDGKQALNYAVRKPIGVVAIITPWNLPLLLLTWCSPRRYLPESRLALLSS